MSANIHTQQLFLKQAKAARIFEDFPENETTNEAKIQKLKRRCERF